MGKIIEIESCKNCPYSRHTDDYDCYCGLFCEKNNKISWTEEEFVDLPQNYIDENCPLKTNNNIMENYEQKYKEALERAKEFISKDNIEVAEYIFPELEESEDESIRKAIIEHFVGSHSSMFPYKGFTKKQVIAWLEKQSNTDVEQVFRPLAGSSIDTAAKQAVEQQKQGKNLK